MPLASPPTRHRREHLSRLKSGIFAVAAATLGYLVAASIHLDRISSEFSLRYSDTHLPMLGDADGYFFLWRSQALLAGKASWLAEPALSALGAVLQLITKLPLELIAYWLPALLAVAASLWLWKWARLLGAPSVSCAFATLVGSLIPEWFSRAYPGWYDTDPGIAFLWHGSLFATACLGLAPGRPALRYASLLVACSLLLGWWWKPGLVLLPACMFMWGATFAFAQDPAWRRIRLATALAVLVGALAFLALPETILPQPLLSFRHYAFRHASMSLGRTTDAALLSIDELSPLTVPEILAHLGGNAVSGLVALAGVLLLCMRAPKPCVFLLPSLGTIVLALYAQRFLYFAALPVALGVGLLPWLAAERKWRILLAGKPLSARAVTALAWSICAAVVLSLGQELYRTPLKFSFQEPQDRIALTLKRVARPDAKLWNWWDDGYFLAARSGRFPLFDGGSQTGTMAYIAAHPLVSSDPLFARRWIRFFALRGKQGLTPLRAAWGDDATVWANLDAVFSAPDIKAALATLPALESGADWLLPQGQVFLYLPQRFLKLSMWWIGMGKTPRHDVQSFKPHIDSFRRTSFRFDAAQGQVALPQEALAKGYTDFGGVFITTRTPLTEPFGGGVPGPYIVTSELTPWLYIVDESAIRSLGFRLLAPGGLPLQGFAPVLVNYAEGGLWEVLP